MEENREQRKVVKLREVNLGKGYMILKPYRHPDYSSGNGQWEEIGRQYDLRGIESYIRGNEKTRQFKLVIDSCARRDLGEEFCQSLETIAQ